MICYYWYFKDISYKFEPHVCNNYHDQKYCDTDCKGVDYKCVLWSMTKNDAINRLNNSKLNDKGTL